MDKQSPFNNTVPDSPERTIITHFGENHTQAGLALGPIHRAELPKWDIPMTFTVILRFSVGRAKRLSARDFYSRLVS